MMADRSLSGLEWSLYSDEDLEWFDFTECGRPFLAWHPSGTKLACLTEKNGEMRVFNIVPTNKVVEHVEHSNEKFKCVHRVHWTS